MDATAEQVSPLWLTGVLHEAGLLGPGEVSGVEAVDSGEFNSRTSFLRLTYRGAPAGLPTRMVLKRSAPAAWAIRAGHVEVEFYRHVAAMPGRSDSCKYARSVEGRPPGWVVYL